MRESLIPGLISNIAYNANRQHKSIQLFERGKTYFKNKAKLLKSVTYNGVNKNKLSFINFKKVNISSSQLRKV